MGLGITSTNSIVFKHGDIGFGASGGVNLWNVFSTGYVMPFYWNAYVSYEYPRWFGLFFTYGWYDKGYKYIYDSGISYSGDIINMYNHAEVSRYFFSFGLQKTFYTSYYQKNWTYIPGSYIGDPSTWRAGQLWSPGTYYYSLNIQIGLRYDFAGKINYSSYFSPLDIPQLISSVEKDDNKINFFIGIKANFDFPMYIPIKTRDQNN